MITVDGHVLIAGSVSELGDTKDVTTIITKVKRSIAILKLQASIIKFKLYVCRAFCAFAVFTSITIITGVLVVCLTSEKKPSTICPLTHIPLNSNSTKHHSNPRSAALGDFNNDKILDIVVANFGTDDIGVFLGLGLGKFSTQITYATGLDSHPYSIALGDFNNDTQLDIVVATYGTHNIYVFLGYGNGSFAFKTQYSTGSSRPVFIAVADLNNDHELDIICANQGTDNLAIRFGNGNGTFLTETLYSTGYDSLPYSIDIADLNNDSKQDIIVANHGTNNIGILFGYDNGTFMDPEIYSTGFGSRPSSVATGDFDNDGRLDIAVANLGTSSVGIFLGRNNTTFDKVILFITTDFTPQYIDIGDMNNDDRLDIVVANGLNDSICVLIGYGNGTFILGTVYFTGFGSNPLSVVIDDLNNDNRSDVVVINNGTNNVGILFGYDPAAFRSQMIYPTGFVSSPAAVTVGDLNNDNLLDIIIANTRSNNIAIRLGSANGIFGNQTDYSTGSDSGTLAVATGDFNNDKYLDITVANPYSHQMGVFLGYGDGKFKDQMTYSTEDYSRPTSIAVGDFNNDHRLDIVVANSDTSNIGVFIGYGNGSFLNQTIYSAGSKTRPLTIAVADLNNDNHVDIIVAHNYDAYIGVFLGYGNGTFADQVTFLSTGGTGMQSVGVGDFNQDNKIDIVFADAGLNLVGILLGYGNGTFADVLKYSFQPIYFPYAITVGDFNNDNLLDIAVANRQVSTVGILLGDGKGGFLSQTTYPTGDLSSPTSGAVGDLNNDGRLDFIVANQDGDNVGVFFGYDSAAFTSQTVYSTGSASRPNSVSVGDFNQDHRLDIVLANYGTETISVLFGDGLGSFDNEIIYHTGDGSLPYSTAVTDCNNDTHLDIIVAMFGNHSLGVFLGYGNGSFAKEKVYSTGSDSSPSSVATGDFNNDSWIDIVVANSGTNNIGLFLGYQYATFINQTKYHTVDYARPNAVAVGDFNNDNQLDIVATTYYNDHIFVFLGYGNGSFIKYVTYSTGVTSRSRSVDVGDINNDNKLDIIIAHESTNSIGIFLGYGNGSFSDQITYSTGDYSNPYSAVVADFNQDNRLDIIVANFGGDNISIFFGYGNGTFEKPGMFSTGYFSRPYCIAIGDFNEDNYTDFVVANYASNTLGIFFGYGNGKFADQIIYSTGNDTAPQSVAVADLNEDDRLDIVVANSGTNTVGVFLGYSNGSFASVVTYATNFGPNSIAIADLNNDNHLDIVVAISSGDQISIFLGFGDGTFGMVTSLYTGYNSQPIAVAIANFNNDNLLDIVVVNNVADDLGILIGYCCEPYVKQTTFSTGNDSQPRSVAVGDLNLDDELDVVVVNEGSDSIGVFFGNGDGTFQEQIVYSMDLDVHPYSVTIGDFNQDTWLDIAIANYGDETVGVMIGKGNGTFTNQTTYWIGLGSRPNFVAIGDFNHDMKLDITVGNDGTNSVGILYGYGNGSFSMVSSFTTGYGSQPCSLAVGDFNNDSHADVIVTNCGDSNLGLISKIC